MHTCLPFLCGRLEHANVLLCKQKCQRTQDKLHLNVCCAYKAIYIDFFIHTSRPSVWVHNVKFMFLTNCFTPAVIRYLPAVSIRKQSPTINFDRIYFLVAQEMSKTLIYGPVITTIFARVAPFLRTRTRFSLAEPLITGSRNN